MAFGSFRDLTRVSGVPLELDPDSGLLRLGKGLRSETPSARRMGDLRELLFRPDPGPDDRPCYWMYRDVQRAVDAPRLEGRGIRYDVTVTLPGTIGVELMKTAGHYHSFARDSALTFPEVYEVLHGEGLFLLQRVRDPRAPLAEVVVEEVLLVRGRPGDRLVIPPSYGHVTINLGAEPLVVSDLIARESDNHYGAIREARGAAYYVLATASGFDAVANAGYGALPPLRRFDSPDEAGLDYPGLPLYAALLDDPGRFAFLVNPRNNPDWGIVL